MSGTAPEADQSDDRWTTALGLPLLGNPFIVAVARAEVLTPDEAAEMLLAIDRGGATPELDERVATAVTRANDDHFRFDVRELHGLDEPSIEVWGSDSAAMATWSVTPTASTRKLTVVVLLHHDGDEPVLMEFPTENRVETLSVGHLFAFPAYLAARPRTVSRATAWVTHAHGPAFR